MTGGRSKTMARIRERYEQFGEQLALAILAGDHLKRTIGDTREDIRRSFDEISPMLACNSIAVLGSGSLGPWGAL